MIRDREKPFLGEIDISTCGDAADYLSVGIGAREEEKTKPREKIEIKLIPWFTYKNERRKDSFLNYCLKDCDHTTYPIAINCGSWIDISDIGMFNLVRPYRLDALSDKNLLKIYEEVGDEDGCPEELSPFSHLKKFTLHL